MTAVPLEPSDEAPAQRVEILMESAEKWFEMVEKRIIRIEQHLGLPTDFVTELKAQK